MLVDDSGFELGTPTREEMLRHQVVLLKHEREDVWLRLAKANDDIHQLVEINERLNHQIIDLRRQLHERREPHKDELARGVHPGTFPTWGMRMPSDEEVLASIAERKAKKPEPP